MGDRANIFFVDDQEGTEGRGVYMYTHWSGAALPEIVQRGLARGKPRWSDAQYLGRILFCELVADDVEGETGFGLSTRLGDNEHAIIRVDAKRTRVSFHLPGRERDLGDDGLAAWTFGEYVRVPIEEVTAKFW